LSPSFKAFSLSVSSLVVSQSYREALSHPGWRKAMEEEINALELNHTWDLIPKPTRTSIVGCRWVFTVKQNPDSTADRLRLLLWPRASLKHMALITLRLFLLLPS
jgi:hypothetical protein